MTVRAVVLTDGERKSEQYAEGRATAIISGEEFDGSLSILVTEGGAFSVATDYNGEMRFIATGRLCKGAPVVNVEKG